MIRINCVCISFLVLISLHFCTRFHQSFIKLLISKSIQQLCSISRAQVSKFSIEKVFFCSQVNMASVLNKDHKRYFDICAAGPESRSRVLDWSRACLRMFAIQANICSLS
ncbi:hypothetical protein BpHYR1_034195 [Brachionus plicatilis]|uniref:Secreted protein n=1 Tax=Brachionus plicatilis TaxID=10195 RepID=A0A3M7RV49_BRAPC|nr:hypothetical protein BpHYR1_034195 [Brachionus plicatilis]